MKLDHPAYKVLPACRGMTDHQIDALTKEAYKRNPKLKMYPVILWIVLFPIALFADNLLMVAWHLDRIPALLIAAAIFCIPVYLYERLVHRPSVNRLFQEIIAEPSAGLYSPEDGRKSQR